MDTISPSLLAAFEAGGDKKSGLSNFAGSNMFFCLGGGGVIGISVSDNFLHGDSFR